MQPNLFNFPDLPMPRHRSRRHGRVASFWQVAAGRRNIKKAAAASVAARTGNLIDKVFGDAWTVEARRSGHGGKIWLARHTCGATKWFGANDLTHGTFKLGFCRKCLQRPDLRIRPFESVYNRLKLVADQGKNHRRCDISLTYEEYVAIAEEARCHYCLVPVRVAAHNPGRLGKRAGHFLDRKDNELGYLKENVVLCCADCNETKSAKYSYEVFNRMTQIFRTGEYEPPWLTSADRQAWQSSVALYRASAGFGAVRAMTARH